MSDEQGVKEKMISHLRVCENLGCSNRAAKKCGRCPKRYCSRTCQTEDWSQHIHECRFLFSIMGHDRGPEPQWGIKIGNVCKLSDNRKPTGFVNARGKRLLVRSCVVIVVVKRFCFIPHEAIFDTGNLCGGAHMKTQRVSEGGVGGDEFVSRIGGDIVERLIVKGVSGGEECIRLNALLILVIPSADGKTIETKVLVWCPIDIKTHKQDTSRISILIPSSVIQKLDLRYGLRVFCIR